MALILNCSGFSTKKWIWPVTHVFQNHIKNFNINKILPRLVIYQQYIIWLRYKYDTSMYIYREIGSVSSEIKNEIKIIARTFVIGNFQNAFKYNIDMNVCHEIPVVRSCTKFSEVNIRTIMGNSINSKQLFKQIFNAISQLSSMFILMKNENKKKLIKQCIYLTEKTHCSVNTFMKYLKYAVEDNIRYVHELLLFSFQICKNMFNGHKLNLSHDFEKINELIYILANHLQCSPVIDITVSTKIVCVGDIHGSFDDMAMCLLINGGFVNRMKYLFLGDLVDRGPCSIEVVVLFYILRIFFPTQFYGIRGNHEDSSMNSIFGLRHEIWSNFGIEYFCSISEAQRLQADAWFAQINKWFQFLPYAAILFSKVIAVHGSIHRDLSLSNMRTWSMETDYIKLSCPKKDVLWSDPYDESYDGPNPRGSGKNVCIESIYDFCKTSKIDFQIRAHQCVKNGYEIHTKRTKTTSVTIFGQSNYCGYDNLSAMAVFNVITGEIQMVMADRYTVANFIWSTC